MTDKKLNEEKLDKVSGGKGDHDLGLFTYKIRCKKEISHKEVKEYEGKNILIIETEYTGIATRQTSEPGWVFGKLVEASITGLSKINEVVYINIEAQDENKTFKNRIVLTDSLKIYVEG